MPDLLLPRLKRDIEARLSELRPAMAEVERLEAARDALLAEAEAERQAAARATARSTTRNGRSNGARPAAPRAAASVAARSTAAAPAPAAAAERGSRGPNQTAILAVVEERPGVSVAEIASVTKIAKPTVATTVSKLKREGVLAAEAGGVKLASRQPLTLTQTATPASSRDDGVSDEEWEAARRDAAA
jgi:hypothetical protein